MKNHIHQILFISTIIIMALLSVQTFTSFIPLKPLNGVIVNSPMPALTFQNYTNGTFQEDFEKFGKDHFGFREWLIPLYNQCNYDLFKKTEHDGFFICKDNWLFWGEMLQDQYESLTFKHVSNAEEMAEIFEKDAKTLYYLQEVLKEYGTTLFVCIAPSKNELYPEYLPENNLFYRKGGIHADEFYVKRFQELGINYLDLNTLYKSLKGKVDYPLFYKTSSHYSHISATYAADTLVKFMEEKSKLNIQNFNFGKPYVDKPKKIDRDLEMLFNLIRPIEHIDYYYVDIEPIPDSTAVKPRWLTIGDSFYWNISEKAREAGIFGSTPFWYYNKEVYNDDGSDFYAENHNIADELLEADIVMILWCPINLYELEHNFVDKALLSLCGEESVNNIVANIKNSPEWYNAIVEQAKQQNKNVEEMIQLNVEWVIKNNIEKYFNMDDIQIPESRNQRIAPLGKYFKGQSPENICKIKHVYRDLKKQNANADDEALLKEAVERLGLAEK